jgi:hypothetical protein
MIKSFSFYLNDVNKHPHLESTLIIGGIDEQFADKNDTWKHCEVIDKNYWAV